MSFYRFTLITNTGKNKSATLSAETILRQFNSDNRYGNNSVLLLVILSNSYQEYCSLRKIQLQLENKTEKYIRGIFEGYISLLTKTSRNPVADSERELLNQYNLSNQADCEKVFQELKMKINNTVVELINFV